MKDLDHGSKDHRGNWFPEQPADIAPLFTFPPKPVKVLKWLPHYFFPYNALFFMAAILWWVWGVPPMEDLRNFSWEWVGHLFIVNAIAVFLWFFIFEWQLYIRRCQGTRYKYFSGFPADRPSRRFWFHSQNTENILRTFLSAVPIWTAFQSVTLYAFANGWGRLIDFDQHWFLFVGLCLIVPIIHEFHFYCIHRLIHTRFLFKWVHSVHHKSVNPSPWSSLSMHPVEHVLYFSTIFYHLILPSHPLIAIYQLHVAGFGAIPGHIGFHKIEVAGNHSVTSHAYIHSLHHRYFEVNYGDGLIPMDKWFGTFHDGTDEAHARMKNRLKV